MFHIRKIVIAVLFLFTVSIMNAVTPSKVHSTTKSFNTTSLKSIDINTGTRQISLVNLVFQPSRHENSTSPRPLFSTVHVATVSSHTVYNRKSVVSPISLSAAERDKVERVVMASCGELDNPLMAEANAQVILDRTISGRFGQDLYAVLNAPSQFEKPWKGGVNSMVKEAVSEVFDSGKSVTPQHIYYYINPNICSVDLMVWKKDKRYVTTVGTGKFIHQYWTLKA